MGEQSFEIMRRAMVASQLRTTAVHDPRVVAAMGAVPRERFVTADRHNTAYVDTGVPLPGGRMLNPPMATGLLLTEAELSPDDHVLLVGAASGYAAALLAGLVRSVVALEESPELLAMIRGAGLADSVTIAEGPLTEGWEQAAPYDVILIDGAIEEIPAALIAQLADRGRLVTGLAERGVTRLAIGRKAGDAFGCTAFTDAAAAPLPGFAQPPAFTF